MHSFVKSSYNILCKASTSWNQASIYLCFCENSMVVELKLLNYSIYRIELNVSYPEDYRMWYTAMLMS